MAMCGQWPISFCSWCVNNDVKSMTELKQRAGLELVHLGINDQLSGKQPNLIKDVTKAGIKISATCVTFGQEDYSTLDTIKATGGIVPNEYWDENRQLVFDAIDLTAEIPVKYLSMHLGFIEMGNEAAEKKMFERVTVLADYAAKKKVMLLAETGQETAKELRKFLEGLAHPAIGVNFDPANMIMYGRGNHIDAVRVLAMWIKHVHVKDATASKNPQIEWGKDVPWCQGQVGCKGFMDALKNIEYEGVLAIEREAGEEAMDDIYKAVEQLRDYCWK